MATGRPGTGFIGLDQWAAANRGASNALANRLVGTAEEEAMRAEQGLNGLVENFDLGQQAQRDRYAYNPTTSAEAAMLAGEGYVAADSLRDLNGYESVMSQADRAGANVRRLGDYYGRQVALQDLAGRNGGGYTSAMQGLDSALVGGAGQQRFNQLGQKWGGLMGRAERAEASSQDTAKGTRDWVGQRQKEFAAEAERLKKAESDARQSGQDSDMGAVSNQQDAWERADETNRRRTQPNRPPPAKKTGGAGLWEGWA